MMGVHSLAINDVREAADRLSGVVHRTPVLSSHWFSGRADRQVFFKCEHLQRAGAFKFRGAYNLIARHLAQARIRGVVTQSSGNHGQAVALAAKQWRIPAFVVMPRGSVQVKREAVRSYGGTIVDCAATLAAREATLEQVRRETGAFYVPPYDHPDVIAGQGTLVLELIEQVRDLDAVIAPVGGGGLLSGLCIAAKAVRPAIRVFGAEPAGADDAARSLAAGRLIAQRDPVTLADGLRTGLGEHTWPIIQKHADAILTVSEAEIVGAMQWVWERTKQVIEPSAAVAVAAVLGERFRSMKGMVRIGVVLSGGNVDLRSLPWLGPGPDGLHGSEKLNTLNSSHST